MRFIDLTGGAGLFELWTTFDNVGDQPHFGTVTFRSWDGATVTWSFGQRA